MKRSRKVALITMGLSTLALTACGEEKKEGLVFTGVEQCVKAGISSRDECQSAYNIALSEHYLVAPTYSSKQKCENDNGGGNTCERAAYNGKHDSHSPRISGFMFFGGRSNSSQPLYRTKNGMGFRNANNERIGSKTGRVKVSNAAAVKPKAKVYSSRGRGGFGGTGSRMASSGRS